MRNIRKLVLLGVATLAVASAAAPAASAVTVQDASTHTALATGDQYNGDSSNWMLHGSIFGITVTIGCSRSAFVITISTNPSGSVASLTFSSCKNQSNTTCNVTTLNTPWSNATTFTSTSNLQWAIPSSGGMQVSGSGCLPLSSTCTFGAGQTANFAWSNAVSVATVNQTVSSSTCGNVTWTADYRARTGGTVGAGNNLEVV